MMVAIHVLHAVERLASTKYDTDAEQGLMRGKPFRCRMMEAHCGDIERSAVARANAMLTGKDSAWNALPPEGRTWGSAALAFCQMSAALAGLDQLMFSLWRSWPYKLWCLLLPAKARDVAMELLRTAECLLDEFSRRWRLTFDTVDALLSPKALAMLVMIGLQCRLDISRVECRHAQLRKFTRRTGTWDVHLNELSAMFLLMRERITAHRRKVRPREKKRGKCAKARMRRRVEKPKAKPKPKQRSGGGGAHRAFCSKRLRGCSMRTPSERSEVLTAVNRCFRDARAAGSEEYFGAVEEGKIARKSFRAGVRGFGLAPSAAKKNQNRIRTRNVAVRNVRQCLGLSQAEAEQRRRNVQDGAGVSSQQQLVAHLDLSLLNHQVESFVQSDAIVLPDKLSAVTTRKHHCESLPADVDEHCQKIPSRMNIDVNHLGSRVGFAQALPESVGEAGLQSQIWIPPSSAIAEKCLSAADASKAHTIACNKLIDMWKIKHEPFRHDCVKPLKLDDPPRPCLSMRTDSDCCWAGFCVCKKNVRDLPMHFANLMHAWLRKGGPAHSAYHKCLCVAQIFAPGIEVFYHVAYGNLQKKRFTLTPLETASDGWQALFPAAVVLQVSQMLPLNMYAALKGLSLEETWYCRMLRLDVDNPTEMVPIFRPGIFVAKSFCTELQDVMYRPYKVKKGSAAERRLPIANEDDEVAAGGRSHVRRAVPVIEDDASDAESVATGLGDAAADVDVWDDIEADLEEPPGLCKF